MEPELLLRTLALLIAVVVLLSNVNLSTLINYVKNLLPKKKTVEIVPNTDDTNHAFLDIVNLWVQLKEHCENYGLSQATDKLNEVFPLLNIEEKNV